MKGLFRLVFPGPSGIRRYSLSEAGELSSLDSEDKGKPPVDIGCDEILILPAAEGLPFRITLPFDDVSKVRKVLPQMVLEVFAHVTPDWHFSWVSYPEDQPQTEDGPSAPNAGLPSAASPKTGFTICGLAFPAQALRSRNDSPQPWRLAIPDVFLIPNGKESMAIFYESPCSSGLLVFGEGGVFERCIPAGRGLPLDVVARHPLPKDRTVYKLADHGKEMREILAGMLENLSGADLSKWREFRREGFLKTAAQAVSALLIAVIVFFHIFLFWECRLFEEHRTRLVGSMTKEFEATFHDQKSVEPISQTQRLLLNLESQSAENFRVPKIPWISWTSLLSRTLAGRTVLEKVLSDQDGWQITGVASEFATIDKIFRDLNASPMVAKVRIGDSQPISANPQNLTGIRFKIEGTWRD